MRTRLPDPTPYRGHRFGNGRGGLLGEALLALVLQLLELRARGDPPAYGLEERRLVRRRDGLQEFANGGLVLQQMGDPRRIARLREQRDIDDVHSVGKELGVHLVAGRGSRGFGRIRGDAMLAVRLQAELYRARGTSARPSGTPSTLRRGYRRTSWPRRSHWLGWISRSSGELHFFSLRIHRCFLRAAENPTPRNTSYSARSGSISPENFGTRECGHVHDR